MTSLRPATPSGVPSSPKNPELDSLISSLETGTQIRSAVLDLLRLSSTHSFYLCQHSLPPIFAAMIQHRMDLELLSDLLQLVGALASTPENADFILDCNLAIPVLIDCVCAPNQSRVIGLRILIELAGFAPIRLRETLMTNDQDRLVELLTLINEDNEQLLAEFFRLCEIIVRGNPDYQGVFGYYLLEKLIGHVQRRVPGAMGALRALLAGNVKNQSQFFEFGHTDDLCALLEVNDSETIELLIETFNGEFTMRFRSVLKESKLFEVIVRKSLDENSSYLHLLSLCVRGCQSLCDVVRSHLSSILQSFLTCSENAAGSYINFFNAFIYNSQANVTFLAEMIVLRDDRLSPRLINLATACLLADSSSSRTVFLTDTNSFVVSMIGFFVSALPDVLEHTVQFLICLCADSRQAATQVIHESSQPISFLAEFIARESFAPSLHAQLCLLLRVFVPFLDDLPYGTSLERIDSALRDFSTHLTQSAQSPLSQYEQSLILSALERPAEQITFPATDSLNSKETDSDDASTSNSDPSIADLSWQIETLRSANELAERQFQDYRQTQNAELEQLVAARTNQLAAENDANLTEIARLRAKVSELETQLDSRSISDQKRIGELKQSLLIREIDLEATISHVRNTEKARVAAEADRLRKECNRLRIEIDLVKSKHVALVAESIKDLKEQERRTQLVIDENRNLKFRLSQLLNCADVYKRGRASGEFAWGEITQGKAALEGRISQLEGENGRLVEEKGNQEARTSELAKANAQLEGENGRLVEEKGNLEARTSELANANAQLETRILRLTSERVEQISKLEFEIRGLTAEKEQSATTDQELQRLRDLCETDSTRIERLTQQNSELQEEVRALKSVTDRKLQLALHDRQQLESRLQDENDALQHELDRLREQHNEVSDREGQLRHTVDSLRQKLVSSELKRQSETDFLKSRIDALEKQESPARPAISSLEFEEAVATANRRLSDRLHQLNHSSDSNHSGDGNTSLIEQYEELHRNESREITDLKQTNARLRRKIDRLQSRHVCPQCEELKGSLAAAQEEVKRCQDELTELTPTANDIFSLLSELQQNRRTTTEPQNLPLLFSHSGMSLLESLLRTVEDLRSADQEIRPPFFDDTEQQPNHDDPNQGKAILRLIGRLSMAV